MVDIGKGESGENRSSDIMLGDGRFGIGNARPVTFGSGASDGRARRHSTAMRSGMRGGIHSTYETVVRNIGGQWYLAYNFTEISGGTYEVIPRVSEQGQHYLTVMED